MTKATNIRILHVLRPETYKKLLKDHQVLLSYRNDPVMKQLMYLQKLVPAILKSNKLTEEEKMKRYKKVMRKLDDFMRDY